MSEKSREIDDLFKQFKAAFYEEFLGRDYESGSRKYDVEPVEKVIRELFDKYLNGSKYPSINELKASMKFRSEEERSHYGTDLYGGLNFIFEKDLEQAFYKALESARFHVGQVKPVQYPYADETPSRDIPNKSLLEKPVNQTKHKKKKASQEHVSERRNAVRYTYETNPNALGNNLDQLTCVELGQRGIEPLQRWRRKFGITSWKEAYKHPKLKPLIQKMFSKDRKKS